MIFWMAKKVEKRGHSHPRVSNKGPIFGPRAPYQIRRYTDKTILLVIQVAFGKVSLRAESDGKAQKLIPNRGPRVPKMEPKWRQTREKSDPAPEMAPRWLPDGAQDPLGQWYPPHGEDFGVSPGTLKSTKNAIFSKNDAPVAVFLSIFAGKAAATNFFIDFPSISE